MTEVAVKKALIRHFETLNASSGKPFITENNVCYDNKRFTPPSESNWFILSFNADEPDEYGIGNLDQDQYSGFFQIDICVPLGKGEEQCNLIYEELAKLFARGTCIADLVDVGKVYSPISDVQGNYYRKVVRVNWTALINNKE